MGHRSTLGRVAGLDPPPLSAPARILAGVEGHHSWRAPWRVPGHGRKGHRELKAEIKSSDLWVMNGGDDEE